MSRAESPRPEGQSPSWASMQSWPGLFVLVYFTIIECFH